MLCTECSANLQIKSVVIRSPQVYSSVSHNTALTAAQKTIKSNCINLHFVKLKRERDTDEANQETSPYRHTKWHTRDEPLPNLANE